MAGWGADTMIGGIGDDRYWVDDVGDVVVELADEGTDQYLPRSITPWATRWKT